MCVCVCALHNGSGSPQWLPMAAEFPSVPNVSAETLQISILFNFGHEKTIIIWHSVKLHDARCRCGAAYFLFYGVALLFLILPVRLRDAKRTSERAVNHTLAHKIMLHVNKRSFHIRWLLRYKRNDEWNSRRMNAAYEIWCARAEQRAKPNTQTQQFISE